MRYIYFYIVLISIVLGSCGISKPDVYSNGIVRQRDCTLKVKKSAKHVKNLRIINYTDSIFPNNPISQFKAVKYIDIASNYFYYIDEQLQGQIEIFKKTDYDFVKDYGLIHPLHINSFLLDSIKNIENLGLIGFQFNKFPIELNELKKLETLRIWWCYRLNDFPEDISSFNELKILDITTLGNSYLPNVIKFPSGLKYLVLDVKFDPVLSQSILNSNITHLQITLSKLNLSLQQKIDLIESLSRNSKLKKIKVHLTSCDEKVAIKSAIKDKAILKNVKLIVDGKPICL